MEHLATPTDPTLRRRKLASETIAAAQRGEINSIETLDPRETSIETIQHIRGILRTQGIIALRHNSDRLQEL